jgi:hypothetical protein
VACLRHPGRSVIADAIRNNQKAPPTLAANNTAVSDPSA